MPNCSNRVHTDMVLIRPSNLLSGDARKNISEGTVVASFGAVRALRKGEVGTRTRLGYSFIVRERERVCCLLVLNLVSSTLSCIRRPRPRLLVLDVCGFV